MNTNISSIENFKNSNPDSSKNILKESFWQEDIWNLSDCPIADGKDECVSAEIIFSDIYNWNLKSEFRDFFYDLICNKRYAVSYIGEQYNNAYKKVKKYIFQNFRGLNSILKIPKEEFIKGFNTYLNTEQIKKQPYFLSFVNNLYNFLESFYDKRPEHQRDIWDVRKLGIDFNKSRSDYLINFTGIKSEFRYLLKKYLNNRLLVQSNISWATARQYSYNLKKFFVFIEIRHAEWVDLSELKREDIENFIQYLRNTPLKRVNKNKNYSPTDNHVWYELMSLHTFISYVQAYSWEQAPLQSICRLITENDMPKINIGKPDDVKYIPDEIWEQVIDNIDNLPKEIVPAILLLEASGFRVSDICMLKMDCIKKQNDGWWLVGDQRKLKELNHKVPISEEIAHMVLAQQEYVKTLSPFNINKENFLFPVFKGIRGGGILTQRAIEYNLNKLARSCKISDKYGEIYKFRNHAFRHRYGVTLINNGMNILHVQKLMAHASPEMTMIYAQIHDTTLRTEWEKAKSAGAIRLDPTGRIIKADLVAQIKENGIELEWIRHNLDSIRLDFGFCIKNPKIKCDFLEQSLEVPCIKNNCRSFHVDDTFLEFYNVQIEKMESDIEMYKKSNRIRSIELILPKLQKYKDIRNGIICNSGLYGHSKSKREYMGKEDTTNGK